MTRIGVLSDTHLPDSPEASAFLARIAERHFPQATVILHAGDIVAPDVLTVFAPRLVFAVRGNMDAAAPDLPHLRVVEAGGVRIGLIHGWGPPGGLVERVRREFAGTMLDCLVFGHSHMPLCERQGGLLLFNPGSATDPRQMPYASIGVLEVEEGQVSGRIIPLEIC